MKPALIPVGRYSEKYNELLGLSLPRGKIFRSVGLPVHIQKRHADFLPYVSKIPDILENPDYVGKNPDEADSIEFIKCYQDNILLAVKLDTDKGYLYVASLYSISQSKLERRLNSGRIIPLDKP